MTRTTKRLAAFAVLAALLVPLTSCGSGGGGRVYHAEFSRAIQIFPAVKVRVLGVEVGSVTDIQNDDQGVRVTFRITDPDIQLPADVKAAVVPMSLLGERYIQLFPAYGGGPTLQSGATIALDRTAVPAEPDELLRSLQDYLSGLDSKTVTSFVENAARAVDGNGAALNSLIHHGTNVIATLSAKRQDLSDLIVELDKLTGTLATRQEAIGRLIRGYNAVAHVLTDNRAALEGTINGLNRASVELAALLIAHRQPLHQDIESLTRTGATLAANVSALAETGHWATKLFLAASRADDYQRDWLRLGNQGQELGALILLRLEQRLMELCQDAGSPDCSTPQYWSANVPSLFCFDTTCPQNPLPPLPALTTAIKKQPAATEAVRTQAHESGHKGVKSLLRDLLDKTVGDPYRWEAK
jgi:virulence factor Mce-like protein